MSAPSHEQKLPVHSWCIKISADRLWRHFLFPHLKLQLYPLVKHQTYWYMGEVEVTMVLASVHIVSANTDQMLVYCHLRRCLLFY